ncbi:hypothetical protein SAMN05216419_103824 [Nitrosomonas cryotolerans]|uniref:Aminoglycoside phosphotransferase domain-containing protein n=1 Tax=Nitrosomonas cryotolerans ATCC 49181 TaxID=1131553 RepID=A0A1N6HSR7_9PROT|nr:bifunctional aminoglycoside phosphotransferase/ATP-binding protein [Nitrosomonas cryotolerans]SFP95843.1 hypothetical protein SAMN05216419_103824 [Nitrosomonas cryotolerans]SIO22811.1 hypothetical protein SAMN02743940_1338 [Nitrosomonas cryotolerans ATCC 49181]
MSLIEALQNPILFHHPVTKFKVIETHISWVLLTGQYAYKIKKPVNFGFLDFSSLKKRHFYCKEEVRLNQRLAPRLYLEVVAIYGSAEQPNLDGQGSAIEYAVKMLQFPQSVQLDRFLAKQTLPHHIINKLAKIVADFHLSIESAPDNSELGSLEHIQQLVIENFQHIHLCSHAVTASSILMKLEQWSRQQLDELTEIFQQRRSQGFIRECHGDMHLKNIALWNDDIIIFDCIEFNKSFFWIDVMNDIAFLAMDFEARQHDILTTRFLNRYLEITRDYSGVQLLRFYKVYRALVRAKVAALRANQKPAGTQKQSKISQDFLSYLKLAERYINPITPCLLINHGLSGSGKSFVSHMLLEKYPAIRIRSDVERKQLFNTPTNQGQTHSNIPEQGIYTFAATRKTYAQLTKIARDLLMAGYSVIVDAANLKQQQRQLLIELADLLRIPYLIIDYQASVKTLHQRIKDRIQHADDVSDATSAVLEYQIKIAEPFSSAERLRVLTIDTEKEIKIDDIIHHIQEKIIQP